MRSTAAVFARRRVYRGGGFRAAPVYRGGGIATDIATPITGRTSITGITSTGASTRRAITAIRYYHGYRHRYCRVIWTYYGPRKICKHRPWYRHYWRASLLRLPYRYW